MCIILISTVIAVGIEIRTMFSNMSVTLADLLLMFLYLEVLAMVRVFWDQQSISITLPLLIAITALARFIILQGKEMAPSGLVYEAVAIVLIASEGLFTLPLGRFFEDSVKKSTRLVLDPKSDSKLFSNRTIASSILEVSTSSIISFLVREKISSLAFAIPKSSINLSVVEL